MSRLLSQIDPNLPPLSSSTTPSPTDLLPSPSKEHPKPDTRMREWTFPSSKPQSTSTSSSPLNGTNNSHGRSSSISQSSNGNGNGGGGTSTRHHEPTLTKDLRHRSNFSLIHPGTPELSIPVPTSSSSPTTTSSSKGTLHSHSPSRAGGGAMSWRNRKRFNDFVYFVVFGGAFVLFSSSLFGVGYRPPLPSTSSSLSSSDSSTLGKVKGILLENVEIAQGFKEKEKDVPPADVYQSVGKLSREDQGGIEFVKDSPEDPSLDDENVHDTHHSTGDSALFPHVNHPDELDSDELHDPHVENRPRPARLPIAHDEDDDVEGSRGSGHRHRHAGHEEEHDSMEEGEDEEFSFEVGEEEADDDEHGQEGDHEHSIDDDDEEDGEEVVVDDTISIGGSPPRSDGQGGENVDELKDSQESLSALEELLLDADDDLEEEEEEEAEPLTLEEEEAQHAALQHRRPIVGGGDALERLRREREELGRARERWEARVREGLPDEDDDLEYEVEDAGEGWQGSGELRHRRMIRRVRR